MDMGWHQVSVGCPKCKQMNNELLCAFSADGEMRFSFVCQKCQLLVQWRTFACQLAHQALCNDLIKEKQTRKERPPLTPPLLAPPLLNHEPTLTDDDIRWEKAMGIDPEQFPEGGKGTE